MMPRWMRVLASMLLLGVFAAPASAQDLQRGAWTGSITQPDGRSFDVGFEVSGEPGDLAIELIPPEDSRTEDDERFLFKDVELTEDRLTFVWDVGVGLACSLERRPGGAWAGTCTDERGQDGGIVMIPPVDS